MGIPCVASGPLIRSSYHAEDDFKKFTKTGINNRRPSHNNA